MSAGQVAYDLCGVLYTVIVQSREKKFQFDLQKWRSCQNNVLPKCCVFHKVIFNQTVVEFVTGCVYRLDFNKILVDEIFEITLITRIINAFSRYLSLKRDL